MDGVMQVGQSEDHQGESDRERLKRKAADVDAELQELLSATPTERFYRAAIALASKGSVYSTVTTVGTRRAAGGKTEPRLKVELTRDKNLTEAHRIADVYTKRIKAGMEKPHPDAETLVALLKSMDDAALQSAE